MTTRVQLAYLLKKHVETDLFESDLPVEIPILGSIRLLTANAMEEAAAGPNAVLGVRVQEAAGDQTIPRFVRRRVIGDLAFPQVSEDNAAFSTLRFRIHTSAQFDGTEADFAVTYEIDNNDCRVAPNNAPLGENWIALVTLEQGNFRLLYRKEGGGPGGGDPCEEWDCEETTNPIMKIKCVLNGCSID